MRRGAFGRYIDQFKEPVRKQKVYIFLVCLACSGLFWVFIRLTNETQATFRQLVSVEGIPEGMVWYDPPVQETFYTWQTTGMRMMFSRVFHVHDTLRLEFSSLPYIRKNGLSCYYVTSNTIANRLQARLEQGSILLVTGPDTLFFGLTEGVRKKVPLRVPLELSFERNFYLYGEVIAEPDSIEISGPKGIVDTLQVLQTTPVQLADLNQTVSGYVRVLPPASHPAVKLGTGQIRYTLQVEEFTESQVEILLDVVCPEGFSAYDPDKVKLFPEKVLCTFKVALRDYQRIDPALFSAFVVCPDLTMDKRQLNVEMGLYPEFVHIDAVRPSAVDFLIMH